MIGRVKKIVGEKGFGFIRDDRGQEYFFHLTACANWDDIAEGTYVDFNLGEDIGRGPRAQDVRVLGRGDEAPADVLQKA